MVLPLLAAAIPALISGGSTLAGGLIGASAERDAANQNYQLGLLNYYQREQERNQAIQEAQRQQRETKLGSTDAQGNRTYFDPVRGWVTELSPNQKALQDLYQTEEMNQLGQDLPAKRAKMFENIARQRGESSYADALKEAMGRVQQENPTDVINRRNRAASEGINEGYDATLQSAMRNAARTGSSNQGKIIGDIGRARGKDLRSAFMQNQEGASAESEDTYSRKLSNLGQLYNMFATRGSAMPDVNYNPRNIEGAAASALSGARSAGGNAGSTLINAFGRQGGTYETDQPTQYGLANTIAQTGSAISAAMNRQGARDQMNYGNQSYTDFLSGNNTGYFPPAPEAYKGTSASQYKQGVGAF